jgi:Apolipoprotein N-acyltransferase N-terminal domain
VRGGTVLRVVAAPVTGVLLAAAFPALDLGPLALVALVPLLLAVETVRPLKAAGLGYLAGLTFFGLHLLWIAQFLSWTGAVAWLAWGALSGVEAAFVAAFFALVPATRPLGAWRLLVLPACWAVLELVRAYHPLGGFPWGLLAVSQHDGGPLLPLARVVGGFGLAAVIVAVNLAVAFWLRALWAWARQGARGRRPEGSGEPRGGAPVGREGSGEPRGGAPVGPEGSGEGDPVAGLERFLEERWRGQRSTIWGDQARQALLNHAIYRGIFDLRGDGVPDEAAAVGPEGGA